LIAKPLDRNDVIEFESPGGFDLYIIMADKILCQNKIVLEEEVSAQARRKIKKFGT
jgi:hypothetical protein